MPQPLSLLKDKLETLYTKKQTRFVWISPEAQTQMTAEEQAELSSIVTSLSLHSISASLSSLHSQYSPKRISSLIFTSGSSGKAKAVAHNVHQHRASALGLLEKIQFKHGDSWLLSLPMYHVSGLSIVHRWLVAGACMKIGSGKLEEDIHGVTHASLVATQLQRLLTQSQTLNLKCVLLGGSHIPSSLGLQAAKQNIETWLGYGMTEAASTVTAKRVNEDDTAGTLLPNRELRVEQGKIYIAGQTLASGYYFQGKLNSLTDDEGWFDTKDLGEWVGNEVRILGREGNMFISGGENVHCEEIEVVINRHEQVNTCIVVAVEDSEFGAVSIALVASNSDLASLNINEWLEGKIERFKRPRQYYILPDELLTSGIKISRKDVKDYVTSHFTNYRVI